MSAEHEEPFTIRSQQAYDTMSVEELCAPISGSVYAMRTLSPNGSSELKSPARIRTGAAMAHGNK